MDAWEKEVADHEVVIISKSWCPFCRIMIQLILDMRIPNVKIIEVDQLGLSLEQEKEFMQNVKAKTNEHRVPQLFVNHKYIGEFDDVVDEAGGNILKPSSVELLSPFAEPEPDGLYSYDLFVLGGGSGGCAAVLEAAKLNPGASLAIADFVTPAEGPMGTTWGVGGTCVNVGCIPKKLMHIAATMGDVNETDAPAYGWEVGPKKHDWKTMCDRVHGYIKTELNEGLTDGFAANGVTYYNKYATLVDRHTIKLTDKDGNEETVTAKYILLAAGGRPNTGTFEGKELCISSDDLFWLDKPPGKTLVIGAAYIALECGGMLTGMGYDVTVMVRSQLLRGFDRECVDKIGAYMEHHGTKFAMKSSPKKFVKGTDKAVGCHFVQDGAEKYEEFDTVLLAIGRKGECEKLGLENAGVWFDSHSGKVEAVCERTNVPNIFCIGDLVANRLELTPVAKMAGKKVVRRLNGETKVGMDYTNIATTVFTPLEYGMVGLNSEEAEEKFGPDGYEAISKVVKPLEWILSPGRDNDANKAFMKIIVQSSNDRIVGFHYCGPNAGELTQAMALAVKCKATKDMLTETIGIHPTSAEYMTTIDTKKADGVKCET